MSTTSPRQYFEAPDGYGGRTIWAKNGDGAPMAVIDAQDVPTAFWPDVVARMTGSSITNDDATVELLAKRLAWCGWYGWQDREPNETQDDLWQQRVPRSQEKWRDEARAVLAALTGVPHA